MRIGILASLLVLGCATKEPTTSAARMYTELPAPLAPRPFQLPEVVEGQLSNGINVVVVENHEVPLVFVQLTTNNGAWTDPRDHAGLASVTVDMMNEGAAGKSAQQISRDLRALASELTSGAGLDGSVVSLRSLKKNLAPSLDLMADVVLEPDFPQAEWDIIRARRVQELKAIPQNPSRIVVRAWNKMMYGETYGGNFSTIESVEAITPEDMRGWYAEHFQPDDLTFLIGGDTTLAEIQPMLEARFGERAAPVEGAERAEPVIDNAGPAVEGGKIYVVDKPGAPQSVIRMGQFVGERTSADATALSMANMALGGQFSSRINLNLREEKGWTYGASSWVAYNYLPGVWNVYTSVQTPYTADSVQEIWTEIDNMRGDKPLTQAELDAGRGDVLGSWPIRFEQPGYLLEQTLDVQRYALPDDWLRSYPDRIRDVALADAQAALEANIKPDELVVLVIGDLSKIQQGLEGLGWPVVRLNPDGTPYTE